MKKTARIKNFFLTGRKQVGKSTLLTNFVDTHSFECFGFTMERSYQDGEKHGLYIRPVHPDSQFIHLPDELALTGLWNGERTVPHPTGFEISGCSILKESLDLAVDILNSRETRSTKPKESKIPVIIMDELGFLEKDAHCFQHAVLNILDSGIYTFGILKYRSNSFTDIIRQRADTQIVEVTSANRVQIKGNLFDHFSG